MARATAASAPLPHSTRFSANRERRSTAVLALSAERSATPVRGAPFAPAPDWRRSSVLALNLSVMSYGRTPQQVDEFYREVQRRISALPGVEHVSSGFSAPWLDDKRLNLSFQFAAQGARRADGQDFRTKFRSVSPGFFDTFGVPIQEGRDFNDGDNRSC